MAKAEQARDEPHEMDPLLEDLASHISEHRASLVFQPTFKEIYPYTELTGIVGFLQGREDLTRYEKKRLKRLAAVAATAIPDRGPSFIKRPEFMEEVESVIGREMDEFKASPENTKVRGYGKAAADLLKLTIKTSNLKPS